MKKTQHWVNNPNKGANTKFLDENSKSAQVGIGNGVLDMTPKV
jgi:hypothetical protein